MAIFNSYVSLPEGISGVHPNILLNLPHRLVPYRVRSAVCAAELPVGAREI